MNRFSATPSSPIPFDLPSYEINIDGKALPVKVERVSVSKVKLDTKNPRLHAELGFKGRDDVTEAEIAEKIWLQNDTKQLFKQILADGGLIEPLFVRANDVIAEGNRRKVCLDKILLDDDIAEVNGISREMRQRFESIYIYRIPRQATDLDTLKLLLDWHVSSKKQWTKPDQTEILLRLYDAGTPISELARRTQEADEEVENRLDSYRLLLAHRQRNPNSTPNFQSNLLSHYRQILNNEQLRGWIEADPANHVLFDSWVARKKIRAIKDTRDMLPEIIETPDGLTMLTEEDKTVKEAYRDLGKGKKYSVFDQIEQCAEAIEDAPWRDLVDLPTNRSKQRKLRRLEKALIALKERTGDSDPAAIA